jgi:arginyl-tRNA synthetase
VGPVVPDLSGRIGVDLAVTVVAPSEPLRSRVREAVASAWRAAEAAGALPALAEGAGRPGVEVERPANPEHGDFASNLALKLARPLRMAPLQIARAIADTLSADTGPAGSALIADVSVAPPGFLNLRLADGALVATVDRVLADPTGWGRVAASSARSVNVEFVSANPTGPLTIGNARGAFVGDLLCRVLEAGGQRVTREYYFNDSGGQIDKLGASVLATRRGEPVPDDGYHGDYVTALAAAIPDDVWAAATAPDADGAAVLGRWAARQVREQIEASLERLGVHFDVWKSEGSLHTEGWVDRAVARLRDGGHVYEEDGALWFRSTTFGDDKDRVIIRSNGQPTYFASDIGYVTEKLSRGFDHLIYIWGADHHGTVARVRNAAEAMGYDREAVQILLYAWVRFVRDGVEVSMSKRAGEFVTLDELLGEVGVDAARWFFGSRAATTEIDFDIELAKRQSNENPVYYVQYAHARIASILRKATDVGLAPAASIGGLLSGAPEAALARAIVRFPEVVEDAAASEETHGVTAYATELATQFHAFYRDARVIDEAEPQRSGARLALVSAARITLASALGLLGISAPDSM